MIILNQRFESFGAALIGLAIFIGFIFIIGLFISGGAWLADKLLPGFICISTVLIVLSFIVFIPAGFFKKFEKFSGNSTILSSFFLALTLWLWCLVLTFKTFGWIGVLIGVILLGIGVIPVGFIAAVISGQFTVLAYVLLLCIFAFVLRKIGMTTLLKYRSARQQEDKLFNDINNNDDVIDAQYVDNGDKEI